MSETEVVQVNEEAAVTPPEPKPARNGLVIALSAVSAALSLIAIITAATVYAKVDAQKLAMADMVERMDVVARQTLVNTIQHDLEGGVVTDDFTVEKVTIFNTANLTATIDIDTQPTMIGVYEGKGAFNLSDRELRAKVMDVLDAAKRYYVESEDSGLIPKWDDTAEITVTILNYEIGTYSGGEFTLVGEK